MMKSTTFTAIVVEKIRLKIVLADIITGLKVVDFTRPHTEINLVALAVDKIGSAWLGSRSDPYSLAFHSDMRPTMTEVVDELEQIRLSGWIPNMSLDSPTSSLKSPD
ncbi:Wall-associated receptor kinase-like 14 [Raphanus sativus]|nr:Wall-associated receptor kinase-like 14 [Raphanus sativus]